MSAESIVKNAISNVPKAVAAGVVDMASGLLLSIKTVESHPQRVLDVLAPATRELFEGEMVVTIENLFKQARGVKSDEHYFQEILVSSTHLWHYFGRMKSNPRVVLTVVAAADVNMGMLLMKCREIAGAETI
jgi:hypothetical protein